ncbi:RNA-binding protein 3-like [Clavelina lepadiformis]|uniref:RNA-binding protein 3-like n=1 Tax=Clavelina lepadiformis TaxID=159417 RepID=UPI0040413038
MGDCKVFVGNLNFKATQLELQDFFKCCKAVKDVAVIMDRNTGRSKGYAFIMFGTEEAAKEAVEKMNEEVFQGRPLAVKVASNQDNNRAFTEFRGGRNNNSNYWPGDVSYGDMGRGGGYGPGPGGYVHDGYGHGGGYGGYNDGGGYGGGYGHGEYSSGRAYYGRYAGHNDHYGSYYHGQ